jgi:DNA-binding NarL/FixJ family response regulator
MFFTEMTKYPPAPTPYRNFAVGSIDNRPIVLVIHASPTVRHALFVTLDLDGFDVCVGGDAAEAILRLAGEKPQAVIAELTAEDTARSDLSQQLRSEPATMHIPLILLSRGSAASHVRERSVSGPHHVALDDGIDRLLDVLHHTVDPLRGQT